MSYRRKIIMIKNAAISICFLVIVFLAIFFDPSNAEEKQIILRQHDLTWLSCRPNDNITKVIETLNEKYQLKMDSMENVGDPCYVTGDDTRAMAWILSIEKSRKGTLIGMAYGRFKKSPNGIHLKTSRGIEFGSCISSIYDKYGNGPVIERTRDPKMNYIDLKYPFIIEETGQRGNLTFVLKYRPHEPEIKATVIKIEWLFDQ